MIEESRSDNGIITLSLNRPDKHNAFDDVLIAALTRKLQEIDADPHARVLILSGEGKSFSAGADLIWMQRMAGYSWDENYQDSLQLASLMSTLAGMTMPTIAVVQGAAYGGGVGLVACCDFAVASDRAKFCLSEVKLGLIPAVISPYVVRAIGPRASRRFFTTGEVFDAQTALRLGLVSQVVESDALQTTAHALAEQIASNGPVAVRECKKLIQLVEAGPITEEMIRETATRIADRRASPEGREGIAAFLEKRTPRWPDADREDITLFEGDEDA